MFDSFHDVSESAWSSLRRFRKSLNSGRAFLVLPWARSCERPHNVKIGASKSFARIVWTWLLESLMVNGAASLGQSFHPLGWQLCSYLPQAHWPVDPVTDRRKFLDWDRDPWAQDLVATWQSAGHPWANHPLFGLHFAIGRMRFPQSHWHTTSAHSPWRISTLPCLTSFALCPFKLPPLFRTLFLIFPFCSPAITLQKASRRQSLGLVCMLFRDYLCTLEVTLPPPSVEFHSFSQDWSSKTGQVLWKLKFCEDYIKGWKGTTCRLYHVGLNQVCTKSITITWNFS